MFIDRFSVNTLIINNVCITSWCQNNFSSPSLDYTKIYVYIRHDQYLTDSLSEVFGRIKLQKKDIEIYFSLLKKIIAKLR